MHHVLLAHHAVAPTVYRAVTCDKRVEAAVAGGGGRRAGGGGGGGGGRGAEARRGCVWDGTDVNA